MRTRSVAALVAGAAIALAGSPARAAEVRRIPANRDKIGAALVARGLVRADAGPEAIDAAVDAYLQSKTGAERGGNRLARKQVDANEAALDLSATAAVRGRKLGVTTDVPASTPRWNALEGTDRLLMILVDFSETQFTWTTEAGAVRTEAGPLHDRIPAPDNTYDLWQPHFDRAHYESMLFTPGGWIVPWGAYAGQRRPSMRDYYLAQSYGRYTMTGEAYGWFTVDKPEAYYGDDDENGNDLGPGTTWDLIADAVGVANAQGAIPWADYDLDGNCVLDHVLFIHAGVDQSAGGGAQGEDAIWAHSWDVRPMLKVADSAPGCPGGLYLSNYTIMPEDGGIGVFAHEYGHDLGLPDEYDTAYTGRGESVQNWSLMSNGSWTGAPAQTEPSNISIWGRYVLGWVRPGENLAVVDVSQLGRDGAQFRLEQSSFWGGPGTLNALRINVPPSRTVFTTPYAGAKVFWGGKADSADARLTRTVDLRGRSGATLSFWTWYDIEEGWDFGLVQISTDGVTWTSLPLEGTTTAHDSAAMPSIVAQLPGFTGYSGGWVQKTADLGAFAGQVVQLRFRYMTDWGTTYGGFFVDEVAVSAGGATLFLDGAETADPAWTYVPSSGAGAWSRSDGSLSFGRYYMAEWRNVRPFSVDRAGTPVTNPDAGLGHSTQYDAYGANPNEPYLYSYSPGLLLWLRDMAYGDNWSQAHVGHGYLLVVDAHDDPFWRPSAANLFPGWGTYPFNTHVQISDATFSLDRSLDLTIGYFGQTRLYQGAAGVPSFDDALRYWNTKTPDASTFLPSFGLVLRVLGEAQDDSAAVVSVGRK